ncbi:MAG: hypothetical protein JWO22_3454 [Frankiales bacterium]|nr:hypothetical protein [Frankiales bacterium]
MVWRELVAIAGTPDKARLLLRDNVYRRVIHNAYVLSDVRDTPEVRLAALRRVVPEHSVVSHWAALWVLGLNVLPRNTDGLEIIDLTVPRGLRLAKRPGLRYHSALMTDADLLIGPEGLVSSSARAFVDMSRSFGIVEGVAFGDAALRAGTTTLDRIAEAVDPAGGLRNITVARTAIDMLEPRSESLMESRLRVGFVLAGGPRLDAQVDLYDEEGTHYGRADLFKDGAAMEYDGRAERLEKLRFVKDRSRGNNISDLEVEVRRFTSDDMFRRTPAQRLMTLMRALEVAARRTRPRLRFGADTLRPPAHRPLPTRGEVGQARRTA